jgi:hypothetical protein
LAEAAHSPFLVLVFVGADDFAGSLFMQKDQENKETGAAMARSVSSAQRDLAYQKELHISWKKPEGGSKLVILNLNQGDFYSLEDPVSIEIWEKLMAGKTLSIVLGDLISTYKDTEPAALSRDLDRFIGELLTNRLVCPCQPRGASA